jgi:hypothetical protein
MATRSLVNGGGVGAFSKIWENSKSVALNQKFSGHGKHDSVRIVMQIIIDGVKKDIAGGSFDVDKEKKVTAAEKDALTDKWKKFVDDDQDREFTAEEKTRIKDMPMCTLAGFK